ncbi:hypothetical protein NSQ54_14080 [Alkalihalobacillus sp. FSL W8-0930]
MKRTKNMFQKMSEFKLFSFLFKKQSLTHLVLVNDQWKQCPDSMDKKLCELLHQRNFYPTANQMIYGVRTNVALIPYKLAFVKASSEAKQERIRRVLRKKGWTVYFYTPENVTSENPSWLQTITASSSQPKNAYLQT